MMIKKFFSILIAIAFIATATPLVFMNVSANEQDQIHRDYDSNERDTENEDEKEDSENGFILVIIAMLVLVGVAILDNWQLISILLIVGIVIIILRKKKRKNEPFAARKGVVITMNTIEKTNKHIMQSYGRLSLAIENGNGVTADAGAAGTVIDFGSGIGTNSLGYCDSDWVEAVCNQVKTLQHTSNYYYNKPSADFAEKLCGITGYTNMFFGNSGAEANECAIKLARKYSYDNYGGKRNKIVTLKNSFHGRTLATLSATGQEDMHKYFFPFVEGFIHIEANNSVDLAEKLSGEVCAVMIEYVQGEGGVVPLESDFVNLLYMLCAEKDILVIADEIQTGAGRTGKFLAGEHYGYKADVTTMAKGLFGGLPAGVCLANEKCSAVLTAGTHGSTFGGNPVVMAGGNVVLDKVANAEFLEEVVKKGDYIREKLSELDEVVSIDGKGLMLGINLKSKKAADVMKSALEKGLLVLTAKEKLRLLPPLTIDYDSIDKGINILSEILKEK
jgi:acetylornithine/N-succinyldiaminopimelate aminotransferase